MELLDVLRGGKGRVPRGAAVVARKRVPMGREHVHGIFRSAAVGAFKRLPVGLQGVRARNEGWASRDAKLGTRERLPRVMRLERELR